ncbi:MAG: hypothetical protein E7055_11055 [Lentisphaerae bacterium]|nr:hypothetical protein [Lentisphaerota bacterium]
MSRRSPSGSLAVWNGRRWPLAVGRLICRTAGRFTGGDSDRIGYLVRVGGRIAFCEYWPLLCRAGDPAADCLNPCGRFAMIGELSPVAAMIAGIDLVAMI